MTEHGYVGDEMTTEPTSVYLHPNVIAYLEAIEAFNRDDLDAVKNHVRADVVYRIPGDSIVAGEYKGIDGFAHILRLLRTESDGTLELTPVAVLADGENVIARARVTARRGTKTLDTENVYAFRFAGGKLADGQVFLSDPAQVDAFWA
jgi:ketosteroid isomerase-like protein